MKSAVLARAGVLMGLLALVSAAGADEVKVPIKDLPKAIVDAVEARFPGAEMKEASKETDKGKTTFEVSLTDKGKAVDVSLTEAGKITEIETEVAVKDLPKAVAGAVARKYPKGTIKSAEEIVEIEDGKETKNFEVIATGAAKKNIEMKISPDGKILSTEEDEE